MKRILIFAAVVLFSTQFAFSLDPEVEADMHLLSAKRHLDDGNYEEASEYFQKILDLGVRVPEKFYFYYARAQYHSEDYAGALESLNIHLDRVGRNDETYFDTLELMGLCEEKKEAQAISRRENAIQDVLDAIDLDITMKNKKSYNHGNDTYWFGRRVRTRIEKDSELTYRLEAEEDRIGMDDDDTYTKWLYLDRFVLRESDDALLYRYFRHSDPAPFPIEEEDYSTEFGDRVYYSVSLGGAHSSLFFDNRRAAERFTDAVKELCRVLGNVQ